MKISSRDAIIHLLWTLAVLILFGIWNFSKTWASANELVQTISLAIGITSLVVGVYAIFQALISGSSLNEVAGGLRSSATQVGDAATRVEEASRILTEKFGDLPIDLTNSVRKSKSFDNQKKLPRPQRIMFQTTNPNFQNS